MQENSTLNIKCQGCHRNTSLINMRKIGTRRLCPICYNYIVSSLNGAKIIENSEDAKTDDNIPKKSDDEGSKRLKRIARKLSNKLIK